MSYDKNTQSRVLALERNLVQICLVLIFPMKVFELLHLITSWERKAMETRGKKRVCKQRICSEFIQKNHRLPERVLPRSKILIDMQRSPKSKVGPRRREGFIAIMHSLKRAREIRLSKVKPGKRCIPHFSARKTRFSPDGSVFYGRRLGELDHARRVQPHDVDLEAVVEGVAEVLLLQDRDRLRRRLRHVRPVRREAPRAVLALIPILVLVVPGAVDLEQVLVVGDQRSCRGRSC